MTVDSQIQFNRRISLVVSDGKVGLDLSDFRIKFIVRQMDYESPNNADITVYNLSDDTIKKIKGEYSRIMLSCGYAGGELGKIFDGTIRQIRVGRESNIDRYVRFMAADTDIAYNFGVVNRTVAAGSTTAQRIKAIADGMGLTVGTLPNLTHVNPAGLARGKVYFGIGKAMMREEAKNINATISYQNGQVQMIDMQGYLPNEVVVLTAQTGLIGMPEQTDQGIAFRCLLNPKLVCGGAVKIDNRSINQLIKGIWDVPYNQWANSIQYGADIAADGLYRAYAIDHTGDTRGQDWYSDCVGLSISLPSNMCTAKD